MYYSSKPQKENSVFFNAPSQAVNCLSNAELISQAISAETNNRLIDWSVDRELINDLLNIKVIYQGKFPIIL